MLAIISEYYKPNTSILYKKGSNVCFGPIMFWATLVFLPH